MSFKVFLIACVISLIPVFTLADEGTTNDFSSGMSLSQTTIKDVLNANVFQHVGMVVGQPNLLCATQVYLPGTWGSPIGFLLSRQIDW